jgi:hypothetical protein
LSGSAPENEIRRACMPSSSARWSQGSYDEMV